MGERYLPSPDDHSDGSSTLPEPELNPLLNPVLAQNMGRWAEVYFTSPPESASRRCSNFCANCKGITPRPQSPLNLRSRNRNARAVTAPVSEIPESPTDVPTEVFCQACGRENPASHRFCGMCGTPVAGQRAAADLNRSLQILVKTRVPTIRDSAPSSSDGANPFGVRTQCPNRR